MIVVVGKDIFGKEVLIFIEKNGVDIRYVLLVDSYIGMVFIIWINCDNWIILYEGVNYKIE